MSLTISSFFFRFLPESPRFLISKGKTAEAKRVFAQIAKWNGCDKVDDATIDKLVFEATSSNEPDSKNNKSKTGYIQLVLNQKYRLKILVFMSLWFSCSLIYYGISFGSKNLSGDIFLNVVFLGLIDATAFPSAVFTIDW